MKKYIKGSTALTFDESTGICSILNGITQTPSGSISFTEEIVEDNPVVAINTFVSRIAEAIRNELLPVIEAEGFNRYTGEKNTNGL